MKTGRIISALASIFCLALFLYYYMFQMVMAGGSFRLHHEVLSDYMASLALYFLGIAFLYIASVPKKFAQLWRLFISLSFLSGIAGVTMLIVRNAAFLSLYDPLNFPVQPRQEVMFPELGWISPWQAIISAALIAFAYFCMGFAWKKK